VRYTVANHMRKERKGKEEGGEESMQHDKPADRW